MATIRKAVMVRKAEGEMACSACGEPLKFRRTLDGFPILAPVVALVSNENNIARYVVVHNEASCLAVFDLEV